MKRFIEWARNNIFVAIVAFLGGFFLLALLGYSIEGKLVKDGEGFASHVFHRSLLHLGWGGILARSAFFGLTQLQSKLKKQFNYKVFFGVPIFLVLAVALNQEFGIPGDFRNAPNLTVAFKSFVDVSTWTISSMYAMWTLYRNSDAAYKARIEYLSR